MMMMFMKKIDLSLTCKKEVEPYSSKHVILRAGAMLIFSVSTRVIYYND